MIDLPTLVVAAAASIGIGALGSTDPIRVHTTDVPVMVDFKGYNGPVVATLFRERLRTIAREAGTRRGDSLGHFYANETAVDELVRQLGVSGVVDAVREYLGLHMYNLDIHITQHGRGDLHFEIMGEAPDGKIFFVEVTGGNELPELIQEAAEHFLLRVDPYVLAVYYFRKEISGGEFQRTLPLIEHCLRVIPGDRSMWPLLLWGGVLFRQGRYDEAIVKFQQVLEIVPNFSEAHALWGRALIAKGDLDGGFDQMRRAVESAPEDPTQRRSAVWPSVYAMLGDELAQQGKDEEAREVYVNGLRLLPYDPHLKAGLGELYLRHRQYDPAVALLRDALGAHPDKERTRDLLGQALAGKLEIRPGSRSP